MDLRSARSELELHHLIVFLMIIISQRSFYNSLRNISSTVTDFAALSPRARQQLELLQEAESLSVQWEDFLSLSLANGLLDTGFVGLDRLARKIQAMVSSKLA